MNIEVAETHVFKVVRDACRTCDADFSYTMSGRTTESGIPIWDWHYRYNVRRDALIERGFWLWIAASVTMAGGALLQADYRLQIAAAVLGCVLVLRFFILLHAPLILPSEVQQHIDRKLRQAGYGVRYVDGVRLVGIPSE
jgi:hypothetical protein